MGTTYGMLQSIKKRNVLRDKVTIVEFVGPPGAGKSTNCTFFVEQLEKKGLQVITLQHIKDHVRGMKNAKKMLLMLSLLFQRSHAMLGYISMLALHRVFSLNAGYRYFRLSIFDLVLKQILKQRRIDIVVLDQWIIQELWSATIFKLGSYNSLAKELPKFYFPTDHIMYFNIDEETASARIEMRSTNLSRFDRMERGDRLRNLKIYSAYLYKLFEGSKCRQKTVISSKSNPQMNASCFIQQLDLDHVNI